LLSVVYFGPGVQEGVAEKAVPSKPGDTELDRAAILQNKVDAAASALRATEAAEAAGQASNEEIYAWSVRLRASEIQAARDNNTALKASTDHLERMRNLHARVKALHGAGSKGGEETKFQASKFYVAEAELMLIDAGGKLPDAH
jgi:hypothetical protein